ncbi:hypothetical protein [Photobacterium sp. TY1-4]|uniref:hypothetical protein n=1 Tax=Photobacterium sp. TY1-4 TaxID=2899122 RepID=UPI0021BEA2C6|nr:hypothetical protein [Photobacterium sp. TY1-4]UXI03652.1 hypothetical protein NH461_24880 [Photobacterium sp. TY1-4]
MMTFQMLTQANPAPCHSTSMMPDTPAVSSMVSTASHYAHHAPPSMNAAEAPQSSLQLLDDNHPACLSDMTIMHDDCCTASCLNAFAMLPLHDENTTLAARLALIDREPQAAAVGIPRALYRPPIA